MRVIYIPRTDANIVSGGDIEHARILSGFLLQLGLDMEHVPVEELGEQDSADAAYLTQIYQIDAAEKVVAWASKKQRPVFISPLFEEGLRHRYRLALKSHGRWYQLTRLIGPTLVERVYLSKESGFRSRSEFWQRQRRLLQQAILLPNTHYELNHLCRWFKLDNPPAAIVPLGIDPTSFNIKMGSQLNNLPEDVRPWQGSYILQVGLISSRKNQIGLLEALPNDDTPIVFVGRRSPYEPDYYNQLKAMAEKRGNVKFFERVSIESLAALYGHAAVHALPSWSERPGLVSLEAAACGTSVVASDSAPIWEYLGDAVYRCKPQNQSSILQAVHDALNQATSSISEQVCTTYTWEKTAIKFKTALDSFLGNPSHNLHAIPISL